MRNTREKVVHRVMVMSANNEARAAENRDASIDVPAHFARGVVRVPSEDESEPERLDLRGEVPEK